MYSATDYSHLIILIKPKNLRSYLPSFRPRIATDIQQMLIMFYHRPLTILGYPKFDRDRWIALWVTCTSPESCKGSRHHDKDGIMGLSKIGGYYQSMAISQERWKMMMNREIWSSFGFYPIVYHSVLHFWTAILPQTRSVSSEECCHVPSQQVSSLKYFRC